MRWSNGDEDKVISSDRAVFVKEVDHAQSCIDTARGSTDLDPVGLGPVVENAVGVEWVHGQLGDGVCEGLGSDKVESSGSLKFVETLVEARAEADLTLLHQSS